MIFLLKQVVFQINHFALYIVHFLHSHEKRWIEIPLLSKYISMTENQTTLYTLLHHMLKDEPQVRKLNSTQAHTQTASQL
jgi:hypothetical protein